MGTKFLPFPWTSSGLEAWVGPARPSTSYLGLLGPDPSPQRSWNEQGLIALERKLAEYADTQAMQSILHPVNKIRNVIPAIIKPIISSSSLSKLERLFALTLPWSLILKVQL